MSDYSQSKRYQTRSVTRNEQSVVVIGEKEKNNKLENVQEPPKGPITPKTPKATPSKKRKANFESNKGSKKLTYFEWNQKIGETIKSLEVVDFALDPEVGSDLSPFHLDQYMFNKGDALDEIEFSPSSFSLSLIEKMKVEEPISPTKLETLKSIGLPNLDFFSNSVPIEKSDEIKEEKSDISSVLNNIVAVLVKKENEQANQNLSEKIVLPQLAICWKVSKDNVEVEESESPIVSADVTDNVSAMTGKHKTPSQ